MVSAGLLVLAGGLLGLDGGFLAHGLENDDVWNGQVSPRTVSGGIRRLVWHSLVSFSSVRKILVILSPISPSGILTSSLREPSSLIRFR